MASRSDPYQTRARELAAAATALLGIYSKERLTALRRTIIFRTHDDHAPMAIYVELHQPLIQRLRHLFHEIKPL
jgi:hypothetical protein